MLVQIRVSLSHDFKSSLAWALSMPRSQLDPTEELEETIYMHPPVDALRHARIFIVYAISHANWAMLPKS